MSRITPSTASGTPVARRTAAEHVQELARTLALQKTEWANLQGVSIRFLTLRSKRHKRSFVGIFMALSDHNIEADIDKWTFFIDGRDVDDFVADLGND